MAITTFANMQIVPEKFSQYVIDRSTALNTLVSAGIASPDATVGKLINGQPEGGQFIQIPMWNPLEGEEDVFGENDVSVGDIKTKQARATLLMRQRAWGSTDLAHVLGGADPMGATIQLIADWRNAREQQVYLSILKGIFATDGALKEHVNDISEGTGEAAYISRESTLDTKQLLGDHYKALGMVFMHSATYTYLQKKELILRQPWINPAGETIEIETYLGYRVIVDDGMPVADAVYDTYFMGKNCFIRQEGTPEGFVATETDRDKLGAKNYLINRWCQIIHPRGLSWVNEGEYLNPDNKYPSNADLEVAANWKLVVDHKKVGLACLRHKLG
jgi:hypothetical protein